MNLQLIMYNSYDVDVVTNCKHITYFPFVSLPSRVLTCQQHGDHLQSWPTGELFKDYGCYCVVYGMGYQSPDEAKFQYRSYT